MRNIFSSIPIYYGWRFFSKSMSPHLWGFLMQFSFRLNSQKGFQRRIFLIYSWLKLFVSHKKEKVFLSMLSFHSTRPLWFDITWLHKILIVSMIYILIHLNIDKIICLFLRLLISWGWCKRCTFFPPIKYGFPRECIWREILFSYWKCKTLYNDSISMFIYYVVSVKA